MEIQTTLVFFKTSGFTLASSCQERLEKEIVALVNEAVTKSRERQANDRTTNGIEAKGKSYMRLVAKNMIEEGKQRGLKVLDEKVFEAARKVLGPLPPLA